MSGYATRESVVLSFLLLASVVQAQTVLWERQNPNLIGPGLIAETFGTYMWAIQDCDGDGITDVLVSDPFSPASWTTPDAGYVGIFSGVSGVTIHEWHGSVAGEQLRAFGPTGDIDGDGRGDFAMVYYSAVSASQVVTLVSGASGAFLPTSSNAYFLWTFPVGDVNQDGFGDFASTGYGGFAVFSGPDGGTTLYSKSLPQWQAMLGRSIVRIPDLDGDGVNELLVGAPGMKCHMPSVGFIPMVGQAFIYSGASGAQLQQFTGTTTCDRFGLGVAAPDVNGDGNVEFVIGAGGTNQLSTYSSSGTLMGTTPYQWWYSADVLPLIAIGDANNDGLGDYAAGCIGNAEIKVFGGNGLQLYSFTAGGGWNLGWSLAALGDVNGDGYADFAAGMPYSGGAMLKGRVRVYSLAPAGLSLFGAGCAPPGAQIPRLGATAPAYQGQPFVLQLQQVAPFESCALVLGLSNTTYSGTPLPLDLGSGCQQLTSIDQLLTNQTVQVSPGVGAATFSIAIPISIFIHGFPFYAQAGVISSSNPGSIAVTRGMRIVIP